jgi:hypothetical protein
VAIILGFAALGTHYQTRILPHAVIHGCGYPAPVDSGL